MIKINVHLPYDLGIALGHLSQKIKAYLRLYKNVCSNIYSNFICNSSKLETKYL